MNDSRNSQLFLKFLRSKCANLTNDIEILLHEVCKWVTDTERQAEQSNTVGGGRLSEHNAQHAPDYSSQTTHLNTDYHAAANHKLNAPLPKLVQSFPNNHISKKHPINLYQNISCKKEDDQINQNHSNDQIISNKSDDQINQNHSLAKNQIIKKIKTKDIQPKKLNQSIQLKNLMRSNYSIDDEVSREQIDMKLKSLTNTLQELKKGINIDESPRNTHEDSDYKSLSNTLYSDINHSNLNTKNNLSEYIQSANKNYSNYSQKDEYSADYQDLKSKSAVELIYIIQTEKNRNREAHKQIKDSEYENNALNKRIAELNNEVNQLEKLSNQQNNEQINMLINSLNESEKEMSRCHNNLIEQEDIIKRLQNDNNNYFNTDVIAIEIGYYVCLRKRI
eukprot:Mrub_02811.p1 GENE.Mrub_02811~~Mrub_02811.p1  ORF type:complete len:392 (-),score=97.12 Mrub_02811:111-1286(-)